MTKHDSLTWAIADALSDGSWTTTDDVADVIGERNLWKRPSDGEHPGASQIGWRIRNNRDKFEIDGKRVRAL